MSSSDSPAASPSSRGRRVPAGGESGPAAAGPSSPPPAPAPEADRDAEPSERSCEISNDNGRGKRPAWGSKPPNGVREVSPVMGAVSWPSLGESSKGGPKPSPSDSIKIGDSAPLPPPAAAVQQVTVNLNNSNPNPNHQRPALRGRGGGGGGNGGNSSHHRLQINGGPVSPPPPPVPVETAPLISPGNPAGQRSEPSPRDMHNNRNHFEHGSSSRGSGFSPHSHGGSDHHRPFNRRGNNGGPHNGGRRDPDRGGYSNHSNDFSAPSPRRMPAPSPRINHPRPQFFRAPPPPPPPPGVATYFGPPPHARAFVPLPMGIPEMASPVLSVPAPPLPFMHPPMTHVMQPAAMVFGPGDPRQLLRQIEFYFSNDNLCKDTYLRERMDDQGWVPVALIAGFNRVRQLTNNIPDNINYILDVLRASEAVEVQGDRIRRRGDWMTWLMNPQSGEGSSSASTPVVLTVNHVADRMQSIVLEQNTGNGSGGPSISEAAGTSRGRAPNENRPGKLNGNWGN